ncbi:unnamed protein product [Adineta steineri]|uniref:Uncharacterized protein n=1 Tax=Adineta steineri TaxID=433720 RepID=A0A815HG75_9BILA|nr:unnamed protein product [Adineta steineri]CAF1354269.1 unnamed protein product [Adineta steineri]
MSKGAARVTFDVNWECGWFPECNAPCQSPCNNPDHKHKKCAAYGRHELKDCVHGKWGFYYSPDGQIQTWRGVHRYNPNGCAMVYLLIYNQDKQQILFDLNKRAEYNLPSYRRHKYKPDDLHEVATNFFFELFSTNNKNVLLPSVLNRFIFADSSVIYPVCVNNECASQILFKNGRKWFDRRDVERAMEFITLEWERKPDKQSYGYVVKDRGAKLARRPVFSLAALVLRWLMVKQDNESVTTSRATSPVPSIPPSISESILTTTSGYASATPSLFGFSIHDEPEDHVNFDEFIGSEISFEIVNFLPEEDETIVHIDESSTQLDLFTILYTQQLDNQGSLIKISTDIPQNEYIVIFYCDNRISSHVYHESSPVYHSTDVKDYLDFINKQTQSQIFLIISGSSISSEIQSTFDCQQVHAIYFLRNYEHKYPINTRKVSGTFNNLDNLCEQLHKDIQFYREQYTHTIRIDIFSRINYQQKLISQLNDKHRTFLTYILFIDILPLVSILEFKLEELQRICEILFSNQGRDTAYYIYQLQKENDNATNFLQDPKFSQIILKIHQLDKFNDLFILQKQFIKIQQMIKTSSSLDNVYISQIITNDILKMMQTGLDEYISIGIFVLATKSLLTARTIARRMVDNGLISILFEIEIIEDTQWIEIDSNHVVFRPGTVFRLKSVHQAPDDVYYAKLKSVDKEFYSVKEQLQLEIDVKLSWLTYGNYLFFLNRFEEGERYFNYLLDKLSSEPVYLSAIYNNMGLLYTKKYEKERNNKEQYLNKALMVYNKVFENTQLINSNTSLRKTTKQFITELPKINDAPLPTIIDYSIIIGHIADIYYNDKNYSEALKSYIEALELSVDKRISHYYQQKILNIRTHLTEQ